MDLSVERALRLYAVTVAVPGGPGHVEVAAAAIEGGATAVQLRAPELPDARVIELAEEISTMASAAGVLFVVNDRVDIAATTRDAGVHLGQSDEPSGARSRLGQGRKMGVSVGTPEQARAAEAEGADYLGVTVFSTVSKSNAEPVGLEGLALIAASTSLPIVGIGGISPNNAAEVIAAGAAGIAVISAIAGEPDPVAAARRLRQAVETALEG